MTLTKLTATLTGLRVAWAAAALLYSACWMLPILRESIGFDGARVAHEMVWELIRGNVAVNSVGTAIAAIFSAIGWMANELFVLGVVTMVKWPRFSVRSLAFAWGIMISWQVAFAADFPLLIGYWFWVAAGAIALWLGVARLAGATHRAARTILVEPITLTLVFAPPTIAAIGLMVDGFA